MSARRCQRAFVILQSLTKILRTLNFILTLVLLKISFYTWISETGIMSELLWGNFWPLEISVKTVRLIVGRNQFTHYLVKSAGNKILSLWKQLLRNEFNIKSIPTGTLQRTKNPWGKVGITFIIVFGENKIVIQNFSALLWNKWTLINIKID